MPYQPPWWYLPIRAARYGMVGIDRVFGGYSWLIEQWLLICESAEHEAEQALIEQAKARNG